MRYFRYGANDNISYLNLEYVCSFESRKIGEAVTAEVYMLDERTITLTGEDAMGLLAHFREYQISSSARDLKAY